MSSFLSSTLLVLMGLGINASVSARELAKDQVQLTILGTNDIHGGIEATNAGPGKDTGGLAFFSGVVQSIKKGLQKQLGNRAGVLVLDGGDQFQGTLISNFNEGQLVIKAMGITGYDAVVPGNHDFDFGPIGWLEDQSGNQAKRREALERVVSKATFPFLSANTFYKNSIKDQKGKALSVTSKSCAPKSPIEIAWSVAVQPNIVKPYLLTEKAGVRVAVIGLDLPGTQSVTTADNVDDLCFADEYDTYLRIRNELKEQADVFVLVLHDGDSNNEHGLAELIARINKAEPLVDAVISGHTHFNYNTKVNGVPVIQSGAGGVNFGRIDLVWSKSKRAIETELTKSWGGVRMFHKDCDRSAADMCQVKDGVPLYEGVPVTLDSSIQEVVRSAKEEVAPLAGRIVGSAKEEIKRDRINESALANTMTDLMRVLSKADVAFLNTGGIRENIRPGQVKYEDLFKVFPFSNHGVVVGPMPAAKVIELIKRSITTCGAFGALMQSGLRVVFERKCVADANLAIDPNAKLIKVETLNGELIYASDNLVGDQTRTFQVATVDFLATGGDGFSAFKGAPLISDIGILREAFTGYLLEHPAQWENTVDGRWKNQSEIHQ